MTGAANIRTAAFRRHIPLGIKLQACLLLLGFTEDEISADGQIVWDHHPALGLRVIDEDTGELRPAPNDPRYIRPLRKVAHDTKTFGRGGTKTIGGDICEIAKTKRIRKSQEIFAARQAILAPATPGPERHRSRPMPCGRESKFKKTMSGKVIERGRSR